MSIDVSRLSIDELKSLRSQIDGIIDGPGDRMDGLDAAVQKMKALREEVARTGKAAIGSAVKSFLAAHSEVDSIRFRAYTPYFNDGDACTYRVGDVYVKMVDGGEDDGDYDDGYTSPWSIGYYAEKEGRTKPAYLESLTKDLKSLNDLFDESEDAIKATFGDHVMVTIGRDGEAEVEEYDHE